MPQLNVQQLQKLLMISVGTEFEMLDQEVDFLEKEDLVTAFSLYRPRVLTANGKKIVDDALRITQGLSILRDIHDDDSVHKYMENIKGIVEANSNEYLSLWKEYHKERGHRWNDSNGGPLVYVGYVGGQPVCISLRTVIIDDIKVVTYEATSAIVDHDLIDEWFKKYAPKTAFTDSGYLNKRDSGNIHTVFHNIKYSMKKLDDPATLVL